MNVGTYAIVPEWESEHNTYGGLSLAEAVEVIDPIEGLELSVDTDSIGTREGFLLNDSSGYPLEATLEFINGTERDVTDEVDFSVTEGSAFVDGAHLDSNGEVVADAYPSGGETPVTVTATHDGYSHATFSDSVSEQLFDPYENITVQLAVSESETVMAGRGGIPVNATAHLVGGAGNISVTDRVTYGVTAPTPTEDYGTVVTNASNATNSTVPAVDPHQATPPDNPLAVTGTLAEHVVSHDDTDTVDVYEVAEESAEMQVNILAGQLYTLGHSADVLALVNYFIVDGAGNTIGQEQFEVEHDMVEAQTSGPIEYDTGEDQYGVPEGMEVHPQDGTGTGTLTLHLYDHFSPINGTLTGSDTVQVVNAEMFGTMAFNRTTDWLSNPTWDFPELLENYPTEAGEPSSIQVNGRLNESVSVHFTNNFEAAEHYYEHDGLIRSPNECGPGEDPDEDDCEDNCPPPEEGGCLNTPLSLMDFFGGTSSPGVGDAHPNQWEIQPPEDSFGNQESLIPGMADHHFDTETSVEEDFIDVKKLNISFLYDPDDDDFGPDPGEYSLNVNGEYSTDVQGIGTVLTSKGTDVTLDLEDPDRGGAGT